MQRRDFLIALASLSTFKAAAQAAVPFAPGVAGSTAEFPG
jgi:hypothetical protein